MTKILLVRNRVIAKNPTMNEIDTYPKQMVQILEVSDDKAAQCQLQQYYDEVTDAFYDSDVNTHSKQRQAMIDLVKQSLLNSTVTYKNQKWSISSDNQSKIINAIQMHAILGSAYDCNLVDADNNVIKLLAEECKELLLQIISAQNAANVQIQEIANNANVMLNTDDEWAQEFNRLGSLIVV
jgi:hypothetical protein